MQFMHVKDIKRRNARQRPIDAVGLRELGEDILKVGLLQPIGVSSLEGKFLVYGNHRLTLVEHLYKKDSGIMFQGQMLEPGIIPVVFANSEDEVILEQMELSENTNRVDMTWQQKAAATAKIKEILQERERRKNPEVKEPVITTTDIIKEAGLSIPTVISDLKLAEHLDDPDVLKAKTRKDAIKIINKKETKKFLAERAASVVVTNKDHIIKKGDCRKLMESVAPFSVKVIVTDPPYGINMHKDQSWDGTWHEYDDTEAYCFNLVEDLLPKWTVATTDQAHLYMFCDFTKFEKLRAIVSRRRLTDKAFAVEVSMEDMLAYNLKLEMDAEVKALIESTTPVWDVMYFPFIWNKGNIAAYPRPEHWPRKSFECVLYAIKGNHMHNKLDLAVLNVNQIQNQDHPAGKPQELYEILVERSSQPGDTILDCFAGQGNLLRGCNRLKRKSINFELSDEYYPLLSRAYEEVTNE